jgi:serine/threonine-protein kinase
MTAMTATGQVLGGRYQLDRFLAGGVMGEVWAATDLRMDLTVAVKVLRPNHINDPIALERFRHEAKLGASLDHPGIAKVHDVHIAPGAEPPWLVQEFVDGMSLSDLIEAAAPFDAPRAVHLVAQAADAAHAAHTLGVVHRDLTPRNLMVTHDDVVKVTDFGIARADALPSLTMAGQVVGTPAYLSPEQVKGDPATPRSDVYSLAVVLYECLAGTRPFAGTNPIDVARAHLDDEPPPLPSFVAPPLAAFVLAAMVKDPAIRPARADEFARRLRAIITQLAPGVAVPSSVFPEEGLPTAPWQPPAPYAGPVNGGGAQPALHTGGAHAPRPRASRRQVRSSVPTGLSGKLRYYGDRTATAVRGLMGEAIPLARQAWYVARPELARFAHSAWENRPATRIGVAGLLAIVLAAGAVLFGSDPASGGP